MTSQTFPRMVTAPPLLPSVEMKRQRQPTPDLYVKEYIISSMRLTRVCQAENSRDFCASFAMPVFLRGKASTGTIRTSTSHEGFAAAVGYSNGPRHADIYSLGMLRNATRSWAQRHLASGLQQLSSRRAEGPSRFRDISKTSSERPVSLSDPDVFKFSGWAAFDWSFSDVRFTQCRAVCGMIPDLLSHIVYERLLCTNRIAIFAIDLISRVIQRSF